MLNLKTLSSKKRNLIVLLVLLVLFYLVSSYFDYFLNNYYYQLPKDSLSLQGRQILLVKDNNLVLREYVDEKNNYKDEIIIKLLTTNIINPKANSSDQLDYYIDQYTKLSTAILPNNTVVWAQNNKDNTKWIVQKSEVVNGERKISTVKEYRIFNLDQFYKDYKAGKVSLTQQIQEGVGLIWEDKFIVTSTNTISFVDAMVSEVDNEKPVEAISRERQLNVQNSEEKIITRERGGLDLKTYSNKFIENKVLYPNEVMWWNYFSGLFGHVYILTQKIEKHLPFEFKYWEYYLPEGKKVYNARKYIVGPESDCGSQFMAGGPCYRWREDSINVYDPKNGTTTIYTHGRYDDLYYVFMHAIIFKDISTDKKLLLTDINQKYFMFDLETKQAAKLFDLDYGEVVFVK